MRSQKSPLLPLRMRIRPWQRVCAILLVLMVVNVYGGTHLLAEGVARDRALLDRNRATLRALQYAPADSLEAVEARRLAARARIRATRAVDLARQQSGRDEIRAQLAAAQRNVGPTLVASLAEHVAEVTESIRTLTAAPLTDDQVVQEGIKLFHLREGLERLRDRTERLELLPPQASSRVLELIQILGRLGEEPHVLAAGTVRSLASLLRARIEANVRANGELQRSLAGGARHPRFPGVDPLTGRPHPLPARPRALELREAPSNAPIPDAKELLLPFRGDPLATARTAGQPLSAPTSADTEQTPDIRFSAELETLAETLGNDPLKMFLFVANEVEYRLYNGSLYGSEGTLQGRVGNDMDQASLLIGLLRVSGIPARYETGTIEIPAAVVPSVVGIQDLKTAANALATAGISATVMYSGNQPAAVRMTRTWVRAYVPYTNYRGVDANQSGGGAPQWIALDPSLKRLSVEQEVDLSGTVTFDVNAYLSAQPNKSPREFYEDALRAYILTSGTRCETMAQATATLVHEPYEYDLLPHQLPFKVVSSTVDSASLSSSHRFSVTMEMLDAYGFTTLSRTVTLPEAYGKRLTLTYPSGSGIYSATSGYVKPTIALDGQILGQASSLSAGTDTPLYTTVKRPGLPSSVHDHPLTAGGSYVLNTFVGPVPEALSAAARSRLSALEASGAPKNQKDLGIGEVAGYFYIDRIQADDDALYGLHKWISMSEYQSVTGGDVTGTYFFGVPYGATSVGYLVNAEVLIGGMPMVGTHSSSMQATIGKLTGFNGSHFEHAVWESTLNILALSATNILQLARQDGQTIFFLNSIADYNAVASQIQHASAVESEMINALNAGEQAIISERPVTRGGKTASGYILFDPRTGAGKYLVNSAYNGGVTIDGVTYTWEDLWNMFQNRGSVDSEVHLLDGSLTDSVRELMTFSFGTLSQIYRDYNSGLDLSTELGRGWNWTWGERLYEDPVGGTVTRVTPKGMRYLYTPMGSGAYSPPETNFDTLVKGGSGFTLTKKDQTVLSFDSSGRLLSVLDRFGKGTRIVRDANGGPDRVTNDRGTTLLELDADSSGRITRMIDNEGREVTYAYDSGLLMSTVDARGETWTYSYDSQGRLIGKIRPDEIPISYIYDVDDRVVSHTTTLGSTGYFTYDMPNRRTLWERPSTAPQSFSFDEGGHLTEWADPNGNKVGYQYDAKGNVTRRIDPRGGATQVGYDARGNVTRIEQPDGAVSAMTWDEQNRPLTVQDTRGSRSYQYGANNSSVTVETGDGRVQTTHFNDQGQVTQVEKPDGSSSIYRYDSKGGLREVDNGAGEVTQYEVDDAGRVTALTDALGQTTQMSYGPNDQVAQVTLPTGASMTLTYSPTGQVETITDATGNTTRYLYRGEHSIGISDITGKTSRYEHDEDGRILKSIDPQGNSSSFEYDQSGRKIAEVDSFGNRLEYNYCADIPTPCDIIDAYGNLWQRAFDDRGRLISETSELGTTLLEYEDCATCGPEGRLNARQDPLGNRTEYTYDSRGRIKTVLDALDQMTLYTYGPDSDRLEGFTDASGATTSYRRNLRGQVTQIVDALSNATSLTRNVLGQVSSRTDANGNTTTYEYDALGNVVLEQFEDGSSQTWSFDSIGRKTRATSALSDVEYRYQDALGRLTSIVDHSLNETLSYTYDPATDLKASVTRPDGTQTFSYSRHKQLIATSLPDGQQLRFRYDGFGRLLEKQFPNGNVQRDGYDRWGRLSSRLVFSGAGVIVSGETYTYDAIHRLISKTNHTGQSHSYAYDELSRVISETFQGDTITYTYDEVGNRLARSVNGVQTESFEYDAGHRLLRKLRGSAETLYSWDDNGNMTSSVEDGITTRYLYDLANRLSSVVRNESTVSAFGYDAEGRRIWRNDSRGEAWTMYDSEDAVVELDAQGGLLRGFAHGSGMDDVLAVLEYTGDTAGTWFYHPNHNGSIIALSGANGQLANAYEYSAFGELEVLAEVVPNDRGFQGRPRDPDLGTFDFRARQFDASLGRFQQSDPRSLVDTEVPRTGLSAGMPKADLSTVMTQPQWLNPFNFVGNNPLNLSDPSGEGLGDIMAGVCQDSSSVWHPLNTHGAFIIGIIFIALGIALSIVGGAFGFGLALGIMGLILGFMTAYCQAEAASQVNIEAELWGYDIGWLVTGSVQLLLCIIAGIALALVVLSFIFSFVITVSAVGVGAVFFIFFVIAYFVWFLCFLFDTIIAAASDP